MADYNAIGHGYGPVRRPDPRLEAAIWSALSDAASVINVGAGAGSYEPSDRYVVAVEPSDTMNAQRSADAAPAVRSFAETLPFRDRSFDAAIAIFTIHHWDDVARGLREMIRVAEKRLVLITMDADVLTDLWFVSDYFPAIAETHAAGFPTIEHLLDVLPNSSCEEIPVPRDCTDGFMAAFWGRPEAYLDPRLRPATSAWHQMPPRAVKEGLDRLRADLAGGEWDRKYGSLRQRASLDVGLRLIRSELRV